MSQQSKNRGKFSTKSPSKSRQIHDNDSDGHREAKHGVFGKIELTTGSSTYLHKFFLNIHKSLSLKIF